MERPAQAVEVILAGVEQILAKPHLTKFHRTLVSSLLVAVRPALLTQEEWQRWGVSAHHMLFHYAGGNKRARDT